MIYTAGYQGHNAAQLLEKAIELNAVVLDIRYSPWSHRPEWRRYKLEEQFGDRYQWVQPWGNVNYNQPGQPIQIVDFAAGLDALIRAGVRFELQCHYILLCGCQNYATCHRKTVAEWLQAEGYSVEELTW